MQEDGVVLVYGLHGDFRRHFSMGNVGGPGGWGKGMESGTLSLPQPTTPLSRRCSKTGFWMPGSSILSLVLGWPSSQEPTASPSVPTLVTSNSAGCQRCQVSPDTPGAAFTAHKCASCPWDHQRQKLWTLGSLKLSFSMTIGLQSAPSCWTTVCQDRVAHILLAVGPDLYLLDHAACSAVVRSLGWE